MKEPEVLAVTTTLTNPSIESSLSDKVTATTEGLPPNYFHHLHDKVLCTRPKGKENAMTICDYISSLKSEINPSDHYRMDTIMLLCSLSTFFNKNANAKSFKEITRQELLSFLDSRRKPEDADPLHKWIGTYNTYRMQLMRFFKWLYYPHVEQKKRPRPSVIENIPQLKRKEKSIYKPTDLVVSKYCKSSL